MNRIPGAVAARLILAAAIALLAAGCIGQQTTRYGMVRDPDTGLMLGSAVSNNVVTDPTLHKNRKVKVRVRNLSGDAAFDLKRFADDLTETYVGVGYEASGGDDFGILVDVNVLESGQIQRNMATEYAFLGAAAGGLTGARSGSTIAQGAGILAGAAFGSVLGSFQTEDTYIVVAEITVGLIKGGKPTTGKTITFSRSPTSPYEDDEDRRIKEERRTARKFKDSYRTKIAVFAGGTNTPQSRIAGMVRERLIRIAGDII